MAESAADQVDAAALSPFVMARLTAPVQLDADADMPLLTERAMAPARVLPEAAAACVVERDKMPVFKGLVRYAPIVASDASPAVLVVFRFMLPLMVEEEADNADVLGLTFNAPTTVVQAAVPIVQVEAVFEPDVAAS